MTSSSTRRAGILGASLAALLLLAACGNSTAPGSGQGAGAAQEETSAPAGPITVRVPNEALTFEGSTVKRGGYNEAEVSGSASFSPDIGNKVVLTAGGKEYPITEKGPYRFTVPGDGRDAAIKVTFKDRTQTLKLATGELDTAGIELYDLWDIAVANLTKRGAGRTHTPPLEVHEAEATTAVYDEKNGWAPAGKKWLTVKLFIESEDRTVDTATLRNVTLTGPGLEGISALNVHNVEVRGYWATDATFEVPVGTAAITVGATYLASHSSTGLSQIVELGPVDMTFDKRVAP